MLQTTVAATGNGRPGFTASVELAAVMARRGTALPPELEVLAVPMAGDEASKIVVRAPGHLGPGGNEVSIFEDVVAQFTWKAEQ